ncbi:MAG TPA: TonB family protein [Methylomirabilota bacterium]
MGWRERLEVVWGRLRAVRRRMRDEPLIGIALSVAFHALVIALIVYFGGPRSAYTVKRGEPLFVELPEIKDEAPHGNPAARTPGPPEAPTPPAAKPAPAAPARAPSPPPKPAEAKSRPPGPPRVAARPSEPVRERPTQQPDKPSPRPPEPPPPEAKSALPTPAPAPAPPATAPAAPPASATSPPAPSAPPSAPSRGGAPGSQVAAIPPDPVFDLKSLGRGGGAGGRGQGRGGIEGEAVPLDSPDPKYSDYLDRVRRAIKDKWGFPCADGAPDRYGCVRREGELVIEFGIAKDGHVPFISLKQSTGSANMDAFALNAIRLAQPFPPVPDVISKTGFPILARFRYILVDQTMTNILR